MRVLLKRLEGTFAANPVARRVLEQALGRLDYLARIGLDYLALDRQARTLSGGEARRVALTTALGSGLVNTLYVLDEPSVGLHPSDVDRLIAIVRDLRDAGNTVVVVEHDLALMRAADLLVDIGPGAGEGGGHLLYTGPPEGVALVSGSVTGEFLSGRRKVLVPQPVRRRSARGAVLKLTGARGHNLKNIDVAFPSGGPLRRDRRQRRGQEHAGRGDASTRCRSKRRPRQHGVACGPLQPSWSAPEKSTRWLLVDQAPIGRSGRSNPVTYLKAYDEIRKTLRRPTEAHACGTTVSGQFSFNVEGGRCNAQLHEGNGFLMTIDMQFLPDVMMRCPECNGTRYRRETLEITYRGKNIAEVLELTARQAFVFFRHRPKVQPRLRPLLDRWPRLPAAGPAPPRPCRGRGPTSPKLASYSGDLAHGHDPLSRPLAAPSSSSTSRTTGLHPAGIRSSCSTP